MTRRGTQGPGTRRGMVLPIVLLALALIGLGAASAAWLVRVQVTAARRADAADAALRRAEDLARTALADSSDWPTAGAPRVERAIAGPDTDEVAIRPLAGSWVVTGRSVIGGISRSVTVLAGNRPVTSSASMSLDALTPAMMTDTLGTRRTPRGPLPGPAWGPWS